MAEYLTYLLALILILIPVSIFLGKYITTEIILNKSNNGNTISSFFNNIEGVVLKACGVNTAESMGARCYIKHLLITNALVFTIAYLLIYFQNLIPFSNNTGSQIDIFSLFHTISSFITNTDQMHLIPEKDLTTVSRGFVLPALMFFSSATGLSTGIMFLRSITTSKIGNFYVDLIKVLVRLLIPVSLLSSFIYCISGSPNTFTSNIDYTTIENLKESLPLGPIAAFQGIKMFGQNGGSYFNANASHPFSTPNYFSNFFQNISMLIIPVSMVFALGNLLKNRKQSIIILLALFSIFIVESSISTYFELRGNPHLNTIISAEAENWSGKETRIGIVPSSIFTISASNASGATNSALESYHPFTIAIMLFNMSIEAIFGGQGLGTVYIINFVLYTAFLIGLMLGKTPEVFGRRIEKNEVVLSTLILLLNPLISLTGTIITITVENDFSEVLYKHIHYFTRVLYEFTSAAANNGSGLEGLIDNTAFLNMLLSGVMLSGWFLTIVMMVLLGSSLSKKYSTHYGSAAIFKTDTLLFCFLLIFISITFTLIIIFPFIIFGPIVELVINN